MKTSDKWEIDWALELIKWEWIKSWCKSALPLEAFRAPFRLLLFGPLPSDNTGILGTVFLCSQTPQTYQKPLLKSDPLIYASAASLRVEHLCARDVFNISSKNKTERKKQNVKNTTQGSVFSRRHKTICDVGDCLPYLTDTLNWIYRKSRRREIQLLKEFDQSGTATYYRAAGRWLGGMRFSCSSQVHSLSWRREVFSTNQIHYHYISLQ